MTTAQIEARRKGGYACLEKYGRDRMREWAKRGGRPKLLTLAEVRQQLAREINLKNERRSSSRKRESKYILRACIAGQKSTA